MVAIEMQNITTNHKRNERGTKGKQFVEVK